MWQEFREFVNRGNVVDLAVAVVIGGAFGRIVTSLVEEILMPLLGLVAGGINLTALQLVIKAAPGGDTKLVLPYGQFLQAIVDFLVIALAIFLLVKLINSLPKKEVEEPEAPEAPPAPSPEAALLTEIRDLLREK